MEGPLEGNGGNVSIHRLYDAVANLLPQALHAVKIHVGGVARFQGHVGRFRVLQGADREAEQLPKLSAGCRDASRLAVKFAEIVAPAAGASRIPGSAPGRAD